MLLPHVVITIRSALSLLFFFLFGHCIVVGVSPGAVVELHVLQGMHLCLRYARGLW